VIILIYTKLRAVMRPEELERSNKLFKQRFLIHLTYVLCKINVVEYTYRSFHWNFSQPARLGVIILIYKKLCAVIAAKFFEKLK